MSPFADFLDETAETYPDRDHAALADLLRCIQFNTDDIASALRPNVCWVISQTRHPVGARLATLDRLVTKFTMQ
jgi:hypothetical protein